MYSELSRKAFLSMPRLFLIISLVIMLSYRFVRYRLVDSSLPRNSKRRGNPPHFRYSKMNSSVKENPFPSKYSFVSLMEKGNTSNSTALHVSYVERSPESKVELLPVTKIDTLSDARNDAKAFSKCSMCWISSRKI